MSDFFYDPTHGSDLKTLKALTKQTKTLKDTRLLLVTHVLPTSSQYIELLNEVFHIEAIVAIPYSSDRNIINDLGKKGFKIVFPHSIEDLFEKACQTTEKALISSRKPLIVQEIGGYLSSFTKTLSSYPHFKGIVEDTNNGHWRYEMTEPHSCPVISIAQSMIKDIEDTLVGDAVIYSVERIFREEFNATIQGSRCGVIGYGKIGTSTALALRGRESIVNVYDINPSKTIRARFEGFSILPLHKMLNSCDLIVGCTGKTSINIDDISHIRSNAILASASTKEEEFDLDAFENDCSFEELSPVVRKYTKKNGSNFFLLAKGTPVNFRDRSILGTSLDLIYSELFICIKNLAEKKFPNGLSHSSEEVHAEVAKNWLKLHENSFYDFRDDKVWSFPKSLETGIPKTFLSKNNLKKPIKDKVLL